MAKYGSPSVGFLLVGGYDLLGTTTEISDVSKEAVMEESTVLGDSWQNTLPVGVSKGTFTQNGFYDDGAAAINAVMAEQESTKRVVCVGLTGNAVGAKMVGLQGAFGSSYSRVLDRGKLHKANVKYTVSGHVDDGVVLQPLATKSADWNTEATSYDAGASSAVGGAAYQQVTTFTGVTGYVGKIRHSADNVTFADLATFTNVTAARNAQRVEVASGTTINRYLAASGDVTGTGSIGVLIGFARY